jgi:hypothetical protein
MPGDTLFPLPLTNYETLLLHDDRPSHPMTAFSRMRFKGFLDPDALESALNVVTGRHPLLRATLGRTRLGRLAWFDNPDWQTEINWHPRLNSSGLPQMGQFDLRQRPGTRWWVVARDDGHDVIGQGHHCVTDGGGMNMILEDFLAQYAINTGATDISLPPLDPDRLRQRGMPKFSPGPFLKTASKKIFGLEGVLEFFRDPPVPLMGRGSVAPQPDSVPVSFPSITTIDLDPTETKKIRATAKKLRVTANVLLIRDLFLAIGTWRKKESIGQSQDMVRISIPINLRGAADRSMPASNTVSLVFLDRWEQQWHDEVSLTRGLYEQLWLIKRFQLEYTYILSLGLLRGLPGGISAAAGANRCFATTYFSNLGPILTGRSLPCREGRLISGNVELKAVDVASVLRPQTHGGFVAFTYAGRLRVVLHYDGMVMSTAQAHDLLETYGQQLRHTIGGKVQ